MSRDIDNPFSPFTGRRYPEGADEGRHQDGEKVALPRAAAPLLDFARLLRRHAFAVAPEQVTGFMQAVTLLGPRSVADLREAALATLAPSPDRRGEFEAHFRSHFYGDARPSIEGEEDEETRIKDDHGAREEENGPRCRSRIACERGLEGTGPGTRECTEDAADIRVNTGQPCWARLRCASRDAALFASLCFV